jgi:hypothetical protein
LQHGFRQGGSTASRLPPQEYLGILAGSHDRLSKPWGGRVARAATKLQSREVKTRTGRPARWKAITEASNAPVSKGVSAVVGACRHGLASALRQLIKAALCFRLHRPVLGELFTSPHDSADALAHVPNAAHTLDDVIVAVLYRAFKKKGVQVTSLNLQDDHSRTLFKTIDEASSAVKHTKDKAVSEK